MSRFCWTIVHAARVLSAGFCIGALVSCGAAENASSPSTPTVPLGATVQVQALPTDDGPVDQLHYRWAAMDGQVKDVNAASTEWTLPLSSGLHFLYVQVTDGRGGFRERRVAVLPEARLLTVGQRLLLQQEGLRSVSERVCSTRRVMSPGTYTCRTLHSVEVTAI